MEQQLAGKRSALDRQGKTAVAAKPAPAVKPSVHPIMQLQRRIGNREAGSFVQTRLKINEQGRAYGQQADQAAEQVTRIPQPQLQCKCACGGDSEQEEACTECQSPGQPLLTKLRVNEPGDQYEQEADEVAERVMRNANPAGPISASQSSMMPLVQRRVAGDGGEVQEAPSIVHDVLSSPGRPLDPEARAYMEPRFGHDFSQVRVHTDAKAAQSARAVNALAYTVGSDVVFEMGQYMPSGDSGRTLLAHELAHVAQGGDQTSIRRAPIDYRISDLPADAASDTDRIFFDRGDATISAAENPKIAAMASPSTRNLTLHGFASEEGPAPLRSVTVADRLNAVETALIAAGHTGARARISHPNDGIGDIDYRHRRSVQVLATPVGLLAAPTTVNSCGTAGSEAARGTELTNCESSFATAHNTDIPSALQVVNAAERDIVTTPTAAANSVVTRFFGGVPRADVNANVTAIAAQVRQLPARHQCHTACDGGCGRPAYNSGAGLGVTGAMMTLCPDFVSASSAFRLETLIHEAAHGNPVERIEDIAYSNTRLVPFLLPADSRRNTDSYVLLMRLVHTAGSMPVGPAAPDVLSGMTAVGAGSDTEQSQRAVAWLESWLNYGDFDTEILYSTIVASLAATPLAWVTADEFNIATMHRLATAFTPDLTDPGPDGSPRTTPPVSADKVRVAAIHDRFDQMYDVVNQRALTVIRAAPGGGESWGGQAARPRLTDTVTVEATFYALSAVEQVKHLVRLMARARSDISAGFEEKYVQAIDLIHTHRGLGP